QPLGVGGGTALLPHAAEEHVPGRAYERNRLPPLASSTLQHPLQAVGGQRPPAGDRELSLAHAAPPRWRRNGRRTLREFVRDFAFRCGTFASDSFRFSATG